MKTGRMPHGADMKFELNLSRFIPAALVLLFGLAIHSISHSAPQRLTDMAALNIQDRSIIKLQKLLKKYQGTEREPEFLARLADLYLERSGMTFRISEGIKESQASKVKTSLYLNSLKESVRILTELLNKYPHYQDNSYARFKRGKAYKELNEIAMAKADFLYLFQHDPHFDMLDSAIIDLADFCADANQHQEALVYLTYMIEKMKGSDYYPVALHKSAWSNFNLARFSQAIELLNTEINYYYARAAKTEGGENKAEHAFLEGAFNDLALFYFEAINKKADFASVDKAVKLFKKLDRTNKFFGQTIIKFAKLLRAYDLLADLTALKDKLISDEMKLPETTEVALLIFQYQFDRKNFKGIDPLLEDLKKIRQTNASPEQKKRIEGTLSNALAELHKLVLKNKMATEIATLMNPLISLTQSVTEILGQESNTSILATFALAETAFAINNFKLATQKYGELQKPEYAKTLEANKLNLQNIALRQIASRYQELKAHKLIPESLTIHALKDSMTDISSANSKLVQEWIVWVDTQSKSLRKTTPEADRQSYVTYSMEVAKLIYEYQSRDIALNRLTEFSLKHAETAEGVTAASVVLDTLLKSQAWQPLYEATQKLLSSKSWKDAKFVQKANEMAADSHFRITVQTTDPKMLQSRTRECKEKFKGTAVAMECAIIEAKTDLNLGEVEKAEVELSSLVKEVKDPTKVQSLLLLRVDASNKLGKFDQAIHDLYQYQSMNDFKDPEMNQTIMQHYWFKRKFKELDELTDNKKVCTGKTSEICERYRVIRILDKQAKISLKETYRNAVHGPKSLAAVWALAALSDPKKLAFQDRIVYLQRISATWEELSPLVQIHLLPLLQERVTDTVEAVRISAPGIAPLTADPASIERRMKLTQEVDTAFAKTMKLPWLEIKIKTAEQLAIFYDRLLQDLRAIQTPENLLKPFEKKISETKEAVVTLQQMAKEFNLTVKAVPTPTTAPNAKDRKVAAQARTVSLETVLLSDAVRKVLLPSFLNEWAQGVSEKRSDYLFYLVSQMESTNADFKTVGPLLRGMILLMSHAPSEAFEMIKSAPDQSLKTQLLARFESQRS